MARDDVVTLGTLFTMMVSDFVVLTPFVSVSVTVKVSVVALALTVPEIRPPVGLIVSPNGNEPVVTVQLKGAVPPDSIMV